MSYNMLNSYSVNEEGLFTGWMGRCYDYGSEIFSLGAFSWDDETRLTYFRYETPANREYVLIIGYPVWEGNRIASVQYGANVDICVYDDSGLLTEVYDDSDGFEFPLHRHTFEYDQHGRLASDMECHYNTNGDLHYRYKYVYEYPAWVAVEHSDAPAPMQELTAYPNPFNPETTISYSIAHAGPVRLDVFNVRGQHVTTLVNKHCAAGTYHCLWQPAQQASGAYLVRLQSGEQHETTKVLLLK